MHSSSSPSSSSCARLFPNILAFFALFGSCTFFVWLLLRGLTSQLEGDVPLPRSLPQVKTAQAALEAYKSVNFLHVFVVCSVAYIYKQSFALPGKYFF